MTSHITSIGTATAPFQTDQMKICEFMQRSLGMNDEEKNQLKILYRASGIKKRHSIIPDYGVLPNQYEFYPKNEKLAPFPGTKDRMEIYAKNAMKVMKDAVENCWANSDVQKEEFTHLIVVSCTGMYAPGPDIALVKELGLSKNIKRTAINFMGCYAAFNAIKVANSFCQADPNSKVLIVCAEFCSIHLQQSKNPDDLLSAALFGDGAAAVIVQSQPSGNLNLAIEAEHCDLFFEGENDMAWRIGDHGFEMRLSSYIPDIIEKGIKPLTENLLKNIGLELSQIDHFAIHPGGKKILDVVEKELDLNPEKVMPSREVLKEYGNMSSPTILFVIKKCLEGLSKKNENERLLAFAFGPGLTLESLLFKIA